MNRALRRQAQRAAGKHRAQGKKGRRRAQRVPAQTENFDALSAAGFSIGMPKLWTPPK